MCVAYYFYLFFIGVEKGLCVVVIIMYWHVTWIVYIYLSIKILWRHLPLFVWLNLYLYVAISHRLLKKKYNRFFVMQLLLTWVLTKTCFQSGYIIYYNESNFLFSYVNIRFLHKSWQLLYIIITEVLFWWRVGKWL